MHKLLVYIEIRGEQKLTGSITGDSYEDARFQYDKAYLSSSYGAPISISLPLQEKPFSALRTRRFFEGLLPEGFSRRAVANWMKADENDYLAILRVLGSECLGAIRIVEDEENTPEPGYERLTMEQVRKLAAEGATKSTEILLKTHLSLTGATGKAGLYLDEKTDTWYLPKGNAPSTHIVKQSHVRLSHIVLNEQLCMLTAKKLGIDVPYSFVINTGRGRDPEILSATRRYDRPFSGSRKIDGLPVPFRLHQEDFAQAMGIAAKDKYEKEDSGYLRRMFEMLRFHCTDPIAEQIRLWKTICYHFLIGNTDCHIKNYSFLYGEDLRRIRLAPVYDIVSTRVYQMTNEMSFYIGGELDIRKINRASFVTAAKDAGLAERLAMKLFDELADRFAAALESACEELAALNDEACTELKNRIIAYGGYANL